jgi:adenine-specific DNA-methyltransferase
MLSNFAVESLGQAEDHLIFASLVDNGEAIDEETAKRLFSLSGCVQPSSVSPTFVRDVESNLQSITEARQQEISAVISDRNARFFEAEAAKLDGWADDLKLGLEREIKELDRQIKEARRAATAALTLEDKLAGQKQIKALESQRNEKRRSLFDAQDRVDKQRDELIVQIERQLTQKTSNQQLFTVRWSIT